MGLSFTCKEVIRKQHPLYGQERIQVTHIKDRFLGGDDSDENLRPLLVSEHIANHYSKAINTENWSIAVRQYGAARILVVNATLEEIDEANKLIAQMPHRR